MGLKEDIQAVLDLILCPQCSSIPAIQYSKNRTTPRIALSIGIFAINSNCETSYYGI